MAGRKVNRQKRMKAAEAEVCRMEKHSSEQSEARIEMKKEADGMYSVNVWSRLSWQGHWNSSEEERGSLMQMINEVNKRCSELESNGYKVQVSES